MPRLQALGHELAYFAFYGLQNGVLNIEGVPIYPMGTHPWGADVIDAHMKHFKADLLITLMDVWVTDQFGKHSEREGWLWAPWTPIDQEPPPPLVLERLQGAHTVLPYAEHGERQLRAAGVENVRYIPHGVDTTLFRPGSADEKRAARERFGIPEDRFVIGMVAANKGWPSRKNFPEQLLAFRQFKDSGHPDALMYLHTLKSTAHGGVDFAQLLWRLELVEGEDVLFCDQYGYTLGMPEPKMAQLYQAFDVLSLVSMGEGFGIPLIEAQASGIPVVTAHNTAMTELTFAGIRIEKQHPFWTQLGSWAMLPDVGEIAAAYAEMYDMLRDPFRALELSERARAGALTFDWDSVVQRFWKPFLEDLEADMQGAEDTGECVRDCALQPT